MEVLSGIVEGVYSMSQKVFEDWVVKVVHLHEGNSTRKTRRGYKYLTLAYAFNPKTGEVLKETSKCSNGDIPCRKRGYSIAYGRIMKKLERFLNEEIESDNTVEADHLERVLPCKIQGISPSGSL